MHMKLAARCLLALMGAVMMFGCKRSSASPQVFARTVDVNHADELLVSGTARITRGDQYKFLVGFSNRGTPAANADPARLELTVEFFTPDHHLLGRHKFGDLLQPGQSGLETWRFYAKDIGGKGDKLVEVRLNPNESFVRQYSRVYLSLEEHTGPWYLD
jgi:hypothetical protein